VQYAKTGLAGDMDIDTNFMYNHITPMGSSHPVFQDGQSSRRKEISRLFKEKRKTIAFRTVVFFVLGASL
jgi:hypothetical protein